MDNLSMPAIAAAERALTQLGAQMGLAELVVTGDDAATPLSAT